MSESVDWQAVQRLTSSQHRRKVAAALSQDGPLTPTAISNRSGLEPTHVSRAMGDLCENGLAELLVPEGTHKGRIYDLTDEGGSAVEVALEVCDDA